MANAESIRHIAHSRAPFSTWLGIVLLFALFGVIVLAIIGPTRRGNDYEETRAKKRLENLKTVREDAEKALNTYAWIDKNKGVVRIPISRAMELTTAQLAQQKPAPAGPIAAPQEQAPPAPGGSAKPGATQPAASPAPQASPSPPTQTAASASPQAATSPSRQGAAVSSPPPQAGQSPAPATASSAAASPSPSKSP
jgi:FtsZ-interacting cell division protein ZipA